MESIVLDVVPEVKPPSKPRNPNLPPQDRSDKKEKITCAYCRKMISKGGMPAHLRLCPVLKHEAVKSDAVLLQETIKELSTELEELRKKYKQDLAEERKNTKVAQKAYEVQKDNYDKLLSRIVTK